MWKIDQALGNLKGFQIFNRTQQHRCRNGKKNEDEDLRKLSQQKGIKESEKKHKFLN